MNRKTLDPNLASILDSIRATVGGEPQAADAAEAPAPENKAEAAPAEAQQADAHKPGAPAARPNRKGAALPPQRTVEDFLAELIRPQVDAWLRANLPEIIQKMAAEEIARLTGKN